MVLLINSCHSKNENKVIEYYSDGSIKTITNIKEGKSKRTFYFDSLGNCSKIIKVNAKDKYQGEQLWFENGILNDKTNYKNGLPDGHSYEFYQSGALKSSRFLIDGLEYELGIDYWDTKVEVVKNSLYFNDNGQIYFKQKFDSLSNFIGEEGVKPKFLFNK